MNFQIMFLVIILMFIVLLKAYTVTYFSISCLIFDKSKIPCYSKKNYHQKIKSVLIG